MSIEENKIEEEEIRDLNLFFGIVIVFSSILILISFFMVNVDTQIIIFSFNLFIIGVAFTGIGRADKEQGVEAANTEIWGGVITTIAGLICFFISVISSNLITQKLYMIYVISLLAGAVAIAATTAERKTRTWSKWLMMLSGIAIAFISFSYILLRILELMGIVSIVSIDDFVRLMNTLLFFSIFSHGLARIIMRYTGTYTKEENL